MKKKKTSPRAQHVNRASQLAHPCLRYLVLSRTAWEKKIPHSVVLQERFDDGSWLEQKEIHELQRAGIRVIERQSDFFDRELKISGHIDGIIEWPGLGEVVLEIKTISNLHFDRINCIEDFIESDMWFYRNYPAQVLAYLRMSGRRYAMIYLKAYGNTASFQKKIITVDAEREDLKEYFEQVLERIRQVNKHVEEGTEPEIDVDYSLCRRCAFRFYCHPDKKDGEAPEFYSGDDESVAEWIRVYLDNKEAARQFEQAKKQLSMVLKEVDKDHVIFGGFAVETKKVERNGYTVDVPPSTYRRIVKIVKVA